MKVNLFKIFGTIGVDNSEAKRKIKDTTKTAKGVGDGFKKGTETAGKSMKEVAAEMGITVNELKSQIMTIANEYRKQGMSASDAMKKAYEDMGIASTKTTDDMEKDASHLGSKIAGIAGQIGKTSLKIIGGIAKAGAAATTAAAAGIAALTKSAVENYAEYEQLVGGVQTLFKDSANIVKGYAQKAATELQISANDYMTTVTSFSASLIQSLDGDTAKAAEQANLAISDMSDNANKMGTDISSIQDAYQGFAKQNYTINNLMSAA